MVAFTFAEYEDRLLGNSTWSSGDWNGDGDFTSGDFVLAFASGGYNTGPRFQEVTPVTVPETPNGLLAVTTSALFVMCFRSGKRHSWQPVEVAIRLNDVTSDNLD